MIQISTSPTLDDLFRRTLDRQPDATALIDSPDKPRITGQTPRRLSFAQADCAIDALAAHFTAMKLPSGSVLGVQLPNSADLVLTLLAAHRADLIVALLPQLWRHADIAAALNSVGAAGLVTMRLIDGEDHADLAIRVAADVFSLRYVGAFGTLVPQGMAPLDQIIDAPSERGLRGQLDARSIAIITFDRTADGLRAVPRTHIHLIASGLAIYLEAGLPQGVMMATMMAPGSFATLAAGMMSWLLTGGTLAFHHPFDDEVLARQIADESCGALVVPGPLLPLLSASTLIRQAGALRHVVALWRAPQQIATSAIWPHPTISVTDVAVFGEAGLFGVRRGETGRVAAIKPGFYGVPRADARAPASGELFVTERGTLALRGSSIVAPAYAIGGIARDFIDTGLNASIRNDGTLAIGEPLADVAQVGAYSFATADLAKWAERLGGAATLARIPDELLTHRLEGHSEDNRRARLALVELGLNPLIADSFADGPAAEEDAPIFRAG